MGQRDGEGRNGDAAIFLTRSQRRRHSPARMSPIPLTSHASSPIPALPRVPSVSVLGVPGVHGGPTDVLMQNSLYLVNRGVAGKNRVARGYDQFGFGAIEMRAAVGNDSVGTFCSAAQSTITHDTMKRHPDWKCGYAIQDRVGRQRK
jgi:hypothetical protein